MKKYKVGNRIITCDSPVKAMEIAKLMDSMKDENGVFSKRIKMSELEALSFANQHGYNIRSIIENGARLTLMYKHNKHIATFNHKDNVLFTDSMKDADYNYLTEEEQSAVEDYRQAIQNTTNPEVLKIFQHILQEELDHIDELKEAEEIDTITTNDERRLNNKYDAESLDVAKQILTSNKIKYTSMKTAAGTNDVHFFNNGDKVAIYSPNRGSLYI